VIFCDSHWPILETNLECRAPIISSTYCDMFQWGLKPAINCNRSGWLSVGTLLLHDTWDKLRPAMLETPRKLKQEVMKHQCQCPDVAPTDFHYFRPSKEALGGRFQCGNDLKKMVHHCLRAVPKYFLLWKICWKAEWLCRRMILLLLSNERNVKQNIKEFCVTYLKYYNIQYK
jgi:hypothetical protein